MVPAPTHSCLLLRFPRESTFVARNAHPSFCSRHSVAYCSLKYEMYRSSPATTHPICGAVGGLAVQVQQGGQSTTEVRTAGLRKG